MKLTDQELKSIQDKQTEFNKAKIALLEMFSTIQTTRASRKPGAPHY